MVEISQSGSGEGPGRVTGPGYSTPKPLDRAAKHRDDQKRRLPLAFELPKPRHALAEQIRDLCRSSIAYLEPHNLRWRSLNETPLPEVVVLRDDGEAILARMLPDPAVGPGTESNAVNMRASRVLGLKEPDKLRAEVLIEQELHATGLARTIHERPTANAATDGSSRPSPSGRLDVLSSTPAAASGPRAANLRRYRRSRDGLHE